MKGKLLSILLIILCIVVVATTLLYNYDPRNRVGIIVLFPAAVGIVSYFLILTVFGNSAIDSKKINYAFLALVIGISMVGTGWGYHLASDQIHETFDYIKGNGYIDPNSADAKDTQLISKFLESKLYNLDENVSHWILASGFAIFILSIILMGVFIKKTDAFHRGHIKSEEVKKRTLLQMFIPKFAGAFTGTVTGIFLIAARTIFEVAILIIVAITIFITTYRKKRFETEIDRSLFVFGIVFLSCIIAIAAAYLLSSTFFDIRFK